MEINGNSMDPPYIRDGYVKVAEDVKPVVMLLGCGTARAKVDYHSLPSQFRRKRAAIVVAALAEILADDAPRVARMLVEGLKERSPGSDRMGDVLLSTKRRLLARGSPAGMLLVAFGDADWRL
jgi:hypothetical protein